MLITPALRADLRAELTGKPWCCDSAADVERIIAAIEDVLIEEADIDRDPSLRRLTEAVRDLPRPEPPAGWKERLMARRDRERGLRIDDEKEGGS